MYQLHVKIDQFYLNSFIFSKIRKIYKKLYFNILKIASIVKIYKILLRKNYTFLYSFPEI